MKPDAYPILRLAIYVAAGIFFAATFGWISERLSLVLTLLSLLWPVALSGRLSYRFRWCFGAGVPVFLFLAGGTLAEHARQEVQAEWPDERKVYVGRLQERPLRKSRSVQCRVETEGRRILLHLPKDSLSEALEIGDELVFFARIRPPETPEGADFDYARYLLRQGIGGTAYAAASYWRKTDAPPVRTLKQEALLRRERLVERFRAWGIGERQLPVFAALTIGHKTELDEATRNAYSVAGIAHVLALSGMHIAIVWTLLYGLLRPLAVNRRWAVVRWLVGTLLLWGFAFVVGLEASVVRAVVMCMLMGLGGLAGVRVLSFNTLGIAAFFMLIYRPFYLFDVGFQLSFVAVASILLFSPLLYGLLRVRGRLLRWTWGVCCVSVSAQLGTAPLVMYYFSTFSVYFLLANLVASLLMPLILFGAFALVAVSFLPWLHRWVVWGLNLSVDALNAVAERTADLPGSSFSLSWMEPVQVTLFYGVLGLLWVCVKTRRRKWLIALLALVALLLAVRFSVLLMGESWTK